MRSLAPLVAAAVALWPAPALADVLLYSQDFEHPDAFVNDGGDINIFRTINQLYHDQPSGFVFSQTFTTETLLIGGTQAFGQGYKDPDGRGGKYVVSQLSDVQDDRLGLAFNVGAFKFLNLKIDVSGIDLDRFAGPFVPPGGAAPVYRFRLFDNPSGAPGVGSGTPLDFFDATAPFNTSKNTFDWAQVVNGLDASGSTNGNVILQIDVLSGGYAAFDNIRVSAADVRAGVPEPRLWAAMLAGFGLLGGAMRRRRRPRSARLSA
jgi:hypothetical protein